MSYRFTMTELQKIRFLGQKKEYRKISLVPDRDTENQVLDLYPEITYQNWEGFGGAITEAAGVTYSLMNSAQKRELVESYFSPEHMNYRFVRIPIDSCDFSLGQYTGFERVERHILPMLRDAEAAHGAPLSLVLSPWSPPVEWKTNDTREQGGKLRPEHYGDYAEYLCRAILWYREQGFSVERLTLQNEPHAVQTWDSCVWTAAEQKLFLRDFMWPAMARHGLTAVGIYLWDHNKERVWEWMRELIDGETDKMIDGAAVHWYSGDHFEALALCRERFPEKKIMVSESCFEYRIYGRIDARLAARKLCHELIGDLNAGVSAVCDWNLLLDETGGPCYAENFCLAPYHYDRPSARLKPHLLQRVYEGFSTLIPPGSERIAHSCFSSQVEASAWKRPDGSLSVLLMNGAEDVRLCLRLNGHEADIPLEANDLAGLLIPCDKSI